MKFKSLYYGFDTIKRQIKSHVSAPFFLLAEIGVLSVFLNTNNLVNIYSQEIYLFYPKSFKVLIIVATILFYQAIPKYPK